MRATCVCGRPFSSRSGATNHGKRCPIERARSAAFVDGVQRGLQGVEFSGNIELAVREAREAHPEAVWLLPLAAPVETVSVSLPALRRLVEHATTLAEDLCSIGTFEKDEEQAIRDDVATVVHDLGLDSVLQ